MSDKRLPWMKFYPSDWSGDEKLSMCSLAARGLLASCLQLMHMAVPYGYLLIHGRRPTYEELAMFVRCKPREVKWGLEELLKNQAVSETAEHVVYSRRMVRDAARSQRSRDNGRKSPGNPLLKPDSGLTQIVNVGVSQIKTSGITPMASGLLSSGSLEKLEDEISERVGNFSERYPAIYSRVRSGAHYRANPVRDYPNFCELVKGWPDVRLDQMLEVFLLMPAKEANNIPGTPGQFLNMAPECDRRLREHGL